MLNNDGRPLAQRLAMLTLLLTLVLAGLALTLQRRLSVGACIDSAIACLRHANAVDAEAQHRHACHGVGNGERVHAQDRRSGVGCSVGIRVVRIERRRVIDLSAQPSGARDVLVVAG